VSARGYRRDLDALREDYAFEKAAVAAYGRLANEAEDPALRALLLDLARAEAGHRRGLRAMIARVEDPATPVVLFCPLCGWELEFGPDPAEGTAAKCRMCPGKFALRLSADRDWELEQLAP
jgi:hypothetical protein